MDYYNKKELKEKIKKDFSNEITDEIYDLLNHWKDFIGLNKLNEKDFSIFTRYLKTNRIEKLFDPKEMGSYYSKF